MKALKKFANIEGSTVYDDGKLATSDTTITLPGITFETFDVNTPLGTMSLSSLMKIADEALTLSQQGIRRTTLSAPKQHKIEIRFVEDCIDADGTVTPCGCKAFLTATPRTLMPGFSIENGATSEGDIEYSWTSYRLVVDNEEVLKINRLTGDIFYNGKDYSSAYKKYL